MTVEWVSAPKVLKEYRLTNGGSVNLKRNLADFLRDGDVRARGRIRRNIKAASVQDAWKAAPIDSFSEVLSADISVRTWRSEKRYEVDVRNWRWPYGSFAFVTKLKPRTWTLIRDVEFRAQDLELLLNPAPAKSRGGRAPTAENWQSFYSAVVELAKNGNLTFAHMKTQANLLRAVSELMDRDELGRTWMQKNVSAVWHKFIEHERPDLMLD